MCFNIVKRKHVLISSSGPIKFNVTLLPKNVQAGTEHINMLLYVFKNTIVTNRLCITTMLFSVQDMHRTKHKTSCTLHLISSWVATGYSRPPEALYLEYWFKWQWSKLSLSVLWHWQNKASSCSSTNLAAQFAKSHPDTEDFFTDRINVRSRAARWTHRKTVKNFEISPT